MGHNLKLGVKIIISNILLIAVALGLSGLFLIERNHHAALEEQTSIAIRENRLFCVSLEGEISNLLFRSTELDRNSIIQAGQYLKRSIEDEQSQYLLYDELGVSLLGTEQVPNNFLNKVSRNEKAVCIDRNGEESYVLSVAGLLMVNNDTFYVVNRRDITATYRERDAQVHYFQIMLLLVITVVGLASGIISYYLTRPIMALNRSTDQIASGNYHVRARAKSSDEIGALARKFNVMAISIEQNMDALIHEGQRKDEFVANFMHEIKTPLTSVIGYADLIRSHELPTQERIMAANYIFQEGSRLERMSMKLFDLLMTDQAEIEFNSIFVQRLLDTVQDSVMPSLQKAGIRLRIQARGVRLMGEVDLLRTALINLIDNARKASAPGTTIYIQAYREGNDILIDVVDQGCGIAQEDIPQLTEAFYMVDKSRSRENGGAGLGLSLVKRILSLHNARLEVESVLGEGTVMRIRFLGAAMIG